jgi:hypothetical protein
MKLDPKSAGTNFLDDDCLHLASLNIFVPYHALEGDLDDAFSTLGCESGDMGSSWECAYSYHISGMEGQYSRNH